MIGEFGQAVIIASIGLLASVATASLSYYFAKKNQLKAEERRLKEEFYRFFIKSLSDVAIDNKSNRAQEDLSEAFNSLLLIAGEDVIRQLMKYHDFINFRNNSIPRDSEEWAKKHDELLHALIKVMRKDLHGFDDQSLPPIHLVGKKLA